MLKVNMSYRTPRYLALAATIRNEISSGHYRVGDRIPSEPDLCRQTGLSRSTVRNALKLLSDEKLLRRIRGSGTFVADGHNSTTSMAERVSIDAQAVVRAPTFHSFTSHAQSMGTRPSTQALDLRAVSPTAAQAVFFGIHPKKSRKLVEITRVRSINDEPVAIETVSLPEAYGGLTREELSGSLYEALEVHYGVGPATGTKTIDITFADERQAFLLDVVLGTALLRVEDRVLDKEGRPLHISVQALRVDRYAYGIEIPSIATSTS
jgi:GntR family transcriptional regulator